MDKVIDQVGSTGGSEGATVVERFGTKSRLKVNENENVA
jgi:hypothetical protein